MKKWYARRRARRLLAEFAPEEAAQVLRLVIGAEVEIDPAIMLMLVERAIEGSTGPGRTVLLKYAEAYRAGRRVKFGTGTTLLEGETPAAHRRRRVGVRIK
jgi:hypothetical protein